MRTHQPTHKHRATEPVPAGERPDATRAHRAPRSTDLPVAAILGILLVLVAACLTVQG
ncbi:MAG TPA: hypothetical protein VNS46_03195 [Nocardioides sp.]|nr:hypothetical protein [Nocardioides sp.]